ncbi:hypothetical protein SAMN02745216_02512 [Desulfatibacillum alkenivorans DSM 16219]|jgi:hypothetical protein|uniref:Uncharacterized protein n=1 Tax=Desulfatibacillum alkenivorans DSM 16219 TaxID=1121393 RepID=A0A1M6N4J6_9BACT|nr:hypothetical protein [Desulfatibacillum alkenivorans]SHJ90617.1 hypothetical protein SAMN02745216_02512 [Desulfatibacillum alkenivorans DSM 16219]
MAIPLKQPVDGQTVQHEWTAEEIVRQARNILDLKDRVMREGIHFGVIPGCRKPSLWKPGAEKLCQAFRLEPQFEIVARDDPGRMVEWTKKDYQSRREVTGTTRGFIEYRASCSLVHIPTGEAWVRNVGGVCNNFETKYRTMNPYDLANTLEKMAEKRAFVAAVLLGTGASDIFTQDVEDLAYLDDGNASGNGSAYEPAQKPAPQQAARNPAPAAQNGAEYAHRDESVRCATEKQINYIRSQLGRKGIPAKDFFEDWEEEFDSLDTIPFNLVNDVLAWIREQ